jgi:hypothetical protein
MPGHRKAAAAGPFSANGRFLLGGTAGPFPANGRFLPGNGRFLPVNSSRDPAEQKVAPR